MPQIEVDCALTSGCSAINAMKNLKLLCNKPYGMKHSWTLRKLFKSILLTNFYDKYMWVLDPVVKLFSLNKSCMYSITQLINLYNLPSIMLLSATTSYNNVVFISYAHTRPISCSKQRIKAIKTTSLTFKNQFSINHKPSLFTLRKWMSLETWRRMDSWRVGQQGRTRR